MSQRRRLFSLLLYLQLLFSVIQTKSISLDIFLQQYVNVGHRDAQGDCCTGDRRCNLDCTSIVRFCLQSRGMDEPSCPHGELRFTIYSDNLTPNSDGWIGTEVGESMRNVTNPISFQVNPGMFQVRTEVTNADNGLEILSYIENVDAEVSDVGSEMMSIFDENPMMVVSYSYRVSCAPTYFGPDCSRSCVPVDDNSGHFTCDENGEKICQSGYTNPSGGSDGRSGSTNLTCLEPAPNIGSNAVTETNATGNTAGSSSGLSRGGVAGIVICLVFLLACVLGGLTAGLLIWKYQPWMNKDEPTKTRTQNALNNPIYGSGIEVTLGKVTSDGAADLRDRTLKNPTVRGVDQSNPLYSSKEDVAEDKAAVMERSVFVENQFLVNILHSEVPPIPPRANPAVKSSEEATNDGNGVSTIDPYASFKDGLPSELAPAGQQQPRLQFDDDDYEDLEMNPE